MIVKGKVRPEWHLLKNVIPDKSDRAKAGISQGLEATDYKIPAYAGMTPELGFLA